jgi:uncharacterized protein YacL
MATKKSQNIDTLQPQKLLPAPTNVYSRKQTLKATARLAGTLLFAVIGFDIGNSDFFALYPLFGIRYASQILITLIAILIGYYALPQVLYQTRVWFERLVVNTIVEIVSKFWELQSQRIQEQRRIKQKTKADAERAKLDDALKTAVVLDTSVLIDGRIAEIIKLNFLDVPMIVPQEVIDELHALSDSKDSLKRQKGRRGLDILKEIKKKTSLIIKTIKNGGTETAVDSLLVKFCKETNTKMATLDFNLSKVAAVNGIKVLNINALANSIKTVLLPGEEIEVKIIHEGKEKQQGIGYLEDGTMLIIEDAKDKVGQTLKVSVTKVIQSPAGKIIFLK